MSLDNYGQVNMNLPLGELNAPSMASLEDFPMLPFLGREVKLLLLHERYFQPFYRLAQRCDFEGSRDVRLSARCWSHERSTATLLIVAGRNESHAKYAEVAYDFFTRGYDVWIYDHRGQGFSQRELINTQIGWVDSFQNYTNDLSIFYHRVLLPKIKKNFYILAHSMGAAITSFWLSQTQVRPNAVAFTAPMIELILKPYPRFVVLAMIAAGRRVGRDQSYIPGGTDFNPQEYGFDLTSSAARRNWNRKLFSTYPEIRLGSPSYQWLDEALKVQEKMKVPQFTAVSNCPLLVWQAGADEVVKPNAQFYLRNGFENSIFAFERRSHHELLQERDEIRARVLFRTLEFFNSASSAVGES